MSNPKVLHAEPTSPLPSDPTRQPRVGRRLVLTVLAVVVLVAALLVLGLDGLIPFGLLLAFSADSDEEESRRSVIAHPAQPRAGRRHVGGLRLVLAVASRPDRVDARAARRGADRPATRAPGLR